MIRRIGRAVVLGLMLVVGVTAAIAIVTQTSWFKDWLRVYIVREAGQYLNGTLSIGRLGGNLFFGIEMENVGVSMDGSQVVAVKDLGLDYNLFELVTSGLSVDNLRLNQPVIYLRRDGDAWSIGRLIKKQTQEADRQGPGRPVSIDAIEVTDGEVIVDAAVGTTGVVLPKRVEHLDATITFQYEPVRYTIGITQLSLRGVDPEIALNGVSGTVSVRNDAVYLDHMVLRTAESSMTLDGAVQHYLTQPVFDLQVRSSKLSLPEIARLVPALTGVALQPSLALTLNGPADHLTVDIVVQSSAGNASSHVVADVDAPQQSVAGTLSVEHLDLSAFLNDPTKKSDITADATLDVRGSPFSDTNSLVGTIALNAPHLAAGGFAAEQVKAKARLDGRRVALDGQVSAYGSRATTSGWVRLPENAQAPVAFELHGQARRVDLRRLPKDLGVPPASTDINADYRIGGALSMPPDSSSHPNLRGALNFAPSTLAGARVADGSTAAFEMSGGGMAYQADATVADLDLQRVGREFRVQALTDDRYRSSINGHVMATGRGTRVPTLDATASGTLQDTSLFGGRIPQLAFDASLRGDVARINAAGSFAGFDPALLSGKPGLAGSVAGILDVKTTAAGVSSGLTPESVEAVATISLGASTIGELAITSGMVDGDYANSTANLRTADLVGRDLNVHAAGVLALNDTGESNLVVHADSPSLGQLGKLIGQPLAGIGEVDATITGNRRRLDATGRVGGSGVQFGAGGQLQALSLNSDFTATVPDFDIKHTTASGTTHGTFVTVAGQNVNDLTAKTDYADDRVTFEVTAKQPQRTLAGAGSLILHPDHQEVHLQRLALETQGMAWQTPPDSEATIRYGQGALTVENFNLVNGAQQISAAGAFGRPDDALEVTVRNVDVAMIDALLLRPPQLTGRLDAAGTISGTTDALRADTRFTINNGAFRQFHYDSFGGTVNYTPRFVELDAKLQQRPDAWIESIGRVPTALLNGTGSTSGDPIDLRIDSTPIDVGIVQGFTRALTNVSGSVEAHVHLTGSAADPLPDGTITIRNAAFRLEPNGVTYTELDGRLDLQPDRIHIDAIRVLDNHQSRLTITGDLALLERRVGEMAIAFKAEDFKVIDNELGNVRVNTDLQLTGQLNAPRLEGQLGITTGQINLDPILSLVGTSAYATEQTEYISAPAAEPSQALPSTMPGLAGIAETMQIDVNLTMPNDVVINGADLRAPNSPISLGALNLTLGGNLYVHQVPYDQVRVYGAINTVRGTYNFQGRRFTILRDGTIRFDGLDQLNPALDIRTERLIQGVTTNVSVRGSLQQPEIVLSSTPPLEQADILSLIVFNAPINQLGSGEQMTLAQRAQGLATGALASGLANSIGNALNLDLFEISTAPANGAAAELTIGQQLGQNLYVKLQQSLGDASQTNFILEYELTSWLRLQTNVLEGSATQQQLFKPLKSTGADLLFFLSY